MNSSVIIAVVAIVVSAIVSIVSATISYKTNLKNIQAKRSEIALEKRLLAFSDVAKEIGKITTLSGVIASSEVKNFEDVTKILNTNDININFLEIYLEQRVFFSKHIDKEIREFIDLMSEFTKEVLLPLEGSEQEFNKTQAKNLHLRLKAKEYDIVSTLQDFVGL